jgi:spore coat protein U-like protein
MPRTDLRALAAAAAFAALMAASPAAGCTISVTPVAFGNYNPISAANDDSTGTLIAVCHPSVSSPVASVDGGSSGSIMARTMRNGAVTLNYNLYTDIGRTSVWGNGGTGATATLTGGSVSGGERTFIRTIYGRIPGLQAVGAGLYTDTLIVTLTF